MKIGTKRKVAHEENEGKKVRKKGIAYHKSFHPSSDNQEFESPSLHVYEWCKLSCITCFESIQVLPHWLNLIYLGRSITISLHPLWHLFCIILPSTPNHELPLNRILAFGCKDHDIHLKCWQGEESLIVEGVQFRHVQLHDDDDKSNNTRTKYA